MKKDKVNRMIIVNNAHDVSYLNSKLCTKSFVIQA